MCDHIWAHKHKISVGVFSCFYVRFLAVAWVEIILKLYNPVILNYKEDICNIRYNRTQLILYCGIWIKCCNKNWCCRNSAHSIFGNFRWIRSLISNAAFHSLFIYRLWTQVLNPQLYITYYTQLISVSDRREVL